MSIETYLAKTGMAATNADELKSPEFLKSVAAHEAAIAAELAPALLADTEVQWQFRVPELGEGGACSLFGQLAEAPYDLAVTLGGKTAANQQLLAKLTRITAYYKARSRSHWFGIYQARDLADGSRALVKLSYFGAESRAEFPLTEEFALGSNNSAVGLSGQARIINDVAAFVASGGGYYTCDPKVKSEACLPLLGANGEVLGIIDAEAFDTGLFTAEELALVVAVAHTLGASVLQRG